MFVCKISSTKVGDFLHMTDQFNAFYLVSVSVPYWYLSFYLNTGCEHLLSCPLYIRAFYDLYIKFHNVRESSFKTIIKLVLIFTDHFIILVG